MAIKNRIDDKNDEKLETEEWGGGGVEMGGAEAVGPAAFEGDWEVLGNTNCAKATKKPIVS